jgi:hypothetical protein
MFAAGKTNNAAPAVVPNYIEDVFSTYLYTGDGTASRAISNGIDLSTKGGMTWIKARNTAAYNVLFDTIRGAGTGSSSGANNALSSNLTSAQGLGSTVGYISAFNTDGFSVTSGGSTTATYTANTNNATYASWTFRKQPKFFDVVTFVGTGGSQTVSHNLQSLPGFIVFKDTTTTGNWNVYARNSAGNYELLRLNSTNSSLGTGSAATYGITTTTFDPGTFGTTSGDTYVAYLFAHNAGGFGLTGTDNVISCGSFVPNSSGGVTVDLGYEPQWVLTKAATVADNWLMVDNMRGFNVNSTDSINRLYASLANAETLNNNISLTSTGFTSFNRLSGGETYVYIAIRRGPMKVPTSGTSVFEPSLYTGNGSTSRTFTTSTVAPIDMSINLGRTGTGGVWTVDRLRGNGVIRTWSTGAEVSSNTSLKFDVQNGYSNTGTAVNYDWNTNGLTNVQYFMKRAPSFFDEVCYTGNYTGGGTLFQTLNHNLGKVPELMIVKMRSSIKAWAVYYGDTSKYIELQSTAAAQAADGRWYSTSPTSTQFTVGNDSDTNLLGETFVNYLFATCAGVSKVGSYTGNGTTQTIDCGLTAGARFVLIKRTDSTGDWYVYDTARGMTTLTDPYLLLNSTAAEVATLGSVTTVSTGFALNSTILAAINVSGGTYIFLAIA